MRFKGGFAAGTAVFCFMAILLVLIPKAASQAPAETLSQEPEASVDSMPGQEPDAGVRAPLEGARIDSRPGQEQKTVVPDVLVTMAPASSPDAAKAKEPSAIIVDKSAQRLHLYTLKNGVFKKIFETDCSTGKQDGPKRVQGDSKTPEGVYFFNDVHEDKELSPIYGVKAFPTDYPNLLDRIAGRTGSAIWLHGLDKPLVPRDSNGCVALENNDVLKLAPYIVLNRTPIIMVESLTYTDPVQNQAMAKAAAGFLKDWETALETGSYHAYLANYAPVYLPDISWWNIWRKYRETSEAKDAPIDVDIRNVSVFRHNDVCVALFDEFLKTDNKARLIGTRKLFMRQEDDCFSIVGDAYQTLAKDLSRGGHPLIAALSIAEKAHTTDAVIAAETPKITQMVDKWLQAWSDKDIKEYGSYYADDFKSNGRDKAAYLKYKNRLNRIYDYIRVERGDLTIEKDKNRQIIASFVQKYRSSGHRTVGVKQLILKKEKGSWKIFRETWKRK